MFTSWGPNFGSAYASWLRGFHFRVFFRKTSEMKWFTSLLVDADPMILQEHREQHSMRDPHCVKACHVAVATAATHRGIRAGHYDQLRKSMTATSSFKPAKPSWAGRAALYTLTPDRPPLAAFK